MTAVVECQSCGYKRATTVVEKDWDTLERCPRCNAYDWFPPPLRVREEDGSIPALSSPETDRP